MTAHATQTNGELLAYCATSGGSYTTIARRVKISFPKRSVKFIETTDLDSTSETGIMSVIIRAGEGSFMFNIDPTGTTDAALEAAFNAGTMYFYKLSLTNTTPSTYIVQAGITEYALGDSTVDGKREATLTLKGTGPFTVSA